MKQVEIKGNSGCNIQLIDNYYILKSTNNPNYVNRLVTQGHKQINEYNRLTNNNLNLMSETFAIQALHILSEVIHVGKIYIRYRRCSIRIGKRYHCSFLRASPEGSRL